MQHCALVTGGASRIGRALALSLAKSGYDVAIQFNASEREAAETVTDIRSLGRRAVALRTNFLRPAEVAGLVEAAIDALGELTLLVNNASIFEEDTLANLTDESFDRHVAINLRSAVLLTRCFGERPDGQHDRLIVNVIDQRVWKLTPHFVSYTLTKSALLTLTKTSAQALAPKGIRVNAIGPGPTLKSMRQDERAFDQQCAATLLKRGSTVQDLSSCLDFLVANRAVTGQMIAVDAGQHLNWQTDDALISE
ncbi:MAG: SDR family oxidoreductase [Pseudomonadota bacterium]